MEDELLTLTEYRAGVVHDLHYSGSRIYVHAILKEVEKTPKKNVFSQRLESHTSRIYFKR